MGNYDAVEYNFHRHVHTHPRKKQVSDTKTKHLIDNVFDSTSLNRILIKHDKNVFRHLE